MGFGISGFLLRRDFILFGRSLFALVVVMVGASGGSAMTVENLTVEYRPHPLGLDVARPRLGWTLTAENRAERQSAYQVRVALAPEGLADGGAGRWDSGRVESGENFGVVYGGPTLRTNTRYFWQVRVWDAAGKVSAWSAAAWWQMGLLDAKDWKGKWIGGADNGSPLLRREFVLDKEVVRATAYAYAVGWYRLSVNGEELSERVLAPVNSNYPKGLFYDTYDLTSHLKPGHNALGLWLGHGYSQNYSKYGYRWDRPPAAIGQVEILYRDGTTETIVTDERWRWAASPVTADDIYNGESYDARKEQAGWNAAGFDERDWPAAHVSEAPAGPLISCPYPSIEIAENLRPVKLTEPRPGVFVFDLGQNIAGWVWLKVSAPSGTQLVLRHAEELLPDGTLDVKTNRKAQATDTYVARGHGEESYEPRFTYHGFRYVELTGFPGKPTLDMLTGRAVHAAVAHAGTFHSSSELLNRMHANFRWSIANNLMGIPTDTASRDERTPCQMDSLAVEEAAIANFGMDPYYSKWLHDISGDGGALPNWTGDQVVLPYLLYLHYGDRRILEEHFGNMKQVVETFRAKAAESKYWADGFGDWAPPRQPGDYESSFSEGEIVATAFYYRSARIVAEVAKLLGEKADADHFGKLADLVRAEFESRHFHAATATYGSGRQVTSILPLAFGMVNPTQERAVFAALRERVETVDHEHLDTGIFGTRYLFDVLIDHGAADLALKVLTNPGYPGYVDQISQGATTTWEQWTYHGSMQTHDHAMFSGPDAAFFTHLGGIQPAAPGYRIIDIRPALPAGLDEVDCTRETPMGKIECHWRRTPGGLAMSVTIPGNATAQITLPAALGARVWERGHPAEQADGVESAKHEAGQVVLKVGSGTYDFAVKSAD